MQKSEILESQPGAKLFFNKTDIFETISVTRCKSVSHFKGCGESVIDRIIGGEAAEGREVPWMCAILRSAILFVCFKGIVSQFVLLIKSHILDFNVAWYCLFWSEGPINPLNLKMLVPDFVPMDLKWQRTRRATEELCTPQQ